MFHFIFVTKISIKQNILAGRQCVFFQIVIVTQMHPAKSRYIPRRQNYFLNQFNKYIKICIQSSLLHSMPGAYLQRCKKFRLETQLFILRKCKIHKKGLTLFDDCHKLFTTTDCFLMLLYSFFKVKSHHPFLKKQQICPVQ